MDDTPPDRQEKAREIARSYWRANLRLIVTLLTIWFLVSIGAGILFVEPLNAIPFGGVPLGFWMAQQGAILVFIVLIAVYAVGMDRIDHAHRYDREEDETENGEEAP